MSKQEQGPQFDFGQQSEAKAMDAPLNPATVIPFVDAITLQVRRDAIRRVAASGIFAPRRG